MLSYVLVSIYHPVYQTALCATSWRNPLDDLPCVEAALAAQSFHGLLLCDLWLAVGSSASRFVVGEFTGRHFTVWTLDTSRVFQAPLVDQFTALYRRHPQWVRSSRLSWSDRRTVRHTPLEAFPEEPSFRTLA